MSEFASLTHKFRANLDTQPAGANKVSKRNRQPLSCAPCRAKKLKCDRGHPCETCIKKGDEASCTYGKSPSASSKPETNSTATRGKAQERLRHLEQLVMQIVDPSAPNHAEYHTIRPNSHAGGNLDQRPPEHDGHLLLGSTEFTYVGSTHWLAILDNIQELKNTLGSDAAPSAELDEVDESEGPESESLFGPPCSLTLAQIISQALPPRLQLDRRLSTYFKSQYLVIPVVHTTQFQRQYEEFWRNPVEASPLWVSILCSICSMSASLSQAVGSEPATPEDQMSPAMTFLTAAGQCLQIGGFIRPRKWVVEALSLYAQCKYMATLDPSREVSIIFTMLVRLAYRSGYHRDPSKFAHISVFEGEMRRRVWAMCRQFDLMMSFQLGMPSIIPPYSWDTLTPRNLVDSDFDEDTKALPPSRPETEPTQILYFIVKSRLMTVFGKICAHVLSFRDCSKQEIMDLDAEVQAVYKTVPETLRAKPMSQSFADASHLIMVRLNCTFLYQKCRLVLHRKFMTQGDHPESTEAAMAAATAITTCMLDLYKEFKPGGQLRADRWMLSSFTMNDFYLATMMLCLSISKWKNANPGKSMDEDEKIKSQYELLVSSYAVCEESSVTSNEAKRVAGVLGVMLGRGVNTTMNVLPSGPVSSNCGATSSSNEYGTGPDMFGTKPATYWPDAIVSNLAPLSLSDRRLAEAFPSHKSHNSSMRRFNADPASTQRQDHRMNGNYMAPFTNRNNATMPIQSTNNRTNPFSSFMPIGYPFPPRMVSDSAAGTTTTTTNTGTTDQHTGATQSTEPVHSPTGPSLMDMDIDWAFLDQWMALPNPEFVAPLPGPLPAAEGIFKTDEEIADADSAPTDSFYTAASWPSAPLRFLGTDHVLQQEQQAPRDPGASSVSTNVSPAGDGSVGYTTASSASGGPHSGAQFPAY